MRRKRSSKSNRAAELSELVVVMEFREVTLETELAPGSGSKEPEDFLDSLGSLVHQGGASYRLQSVDPVHL